MNHKQSLSLLTLTPEGHEAAVRLAGFLSKNGLSCDIKVVAFHDGDIAPPVSEHGGANVHIQSAVVFQPTERRSA